MKKSKEKKADIPAQITKSRLRLMKIVTLLLPFLLLGLIEAALILFDYGHNLDLFVEKTIENKEYKQASRYVALRFFPNAKAVPSPSYDIFLKDKPENGFRIFVLGGSSAAGYPYGENVMFSRILHGWLDAAFTDKTIEVVNLAMPAVNSYSMLDFVDEILENEADLVLIYAGHNEYYGALGIGSSVTLGKYPSLVNFILKLQKLKTVQWLTAIIGSVSGSFDDRESSGNATLMERMVEEQTIPYNSELYYAGLNQFESNLREIIRRFKENNINVVVSELVSNIRDQKPFISLPGKYDADKKYQQALQHYKTGNIDSARSQFYQAKDYDALRFRAPEAFNTIIHQLAREYDFAVVNLKQYYESVSRRNIIGDELMLEHLHPNIDGYALMAKAFYDVIESHAFINRKQKNIHTEPDTKNLGITALDSTYAALRIHILKGGWPFKPKSMPNTAFNDFEQKNRVDSVAVKVWTDANYTLERGHVELAEYYEKNKRPDLALHEYHALTRLTPYNLSPYQKAAMILINHNMYAQAVPYLLRSLKISENFYANKWLGQIYLQDNKVDVALDYLQKAQELNTNDAQLLYNYSGALFMKKNYSRSLEMLTHLEKIRPGFPGAQKLKNHIESLIEN